MIFMRSNPDRIKVIAKAFLEEKKIQYVELNEPRFVPADQNNDMPVDSWVVNYVYTVFEDEDAFMHIDDNSEKVQYIHFSTGYLYGAPPGMEGLRRDEAYLRQVGYYDDDED